ncbi:hypothetical protein OBV_34250 [Oscillibacter valericigenes Sjm18-20]|nr:hypothetical protein OBV_34250 [Oscillibacter valericigenes Sjm18-20]
MGQAVSMGNAVLKVSSEAMYLKAQDAETQLGEMRESFDRMQSLVKNSDAYWQGEAGDLHRAVYAECQKRAEEMFKRLQAHVDDLRLMAAGYERVESANTSGMEVLSSDVIF